MNSTIQCNRNYENVLELLNQIAPNNDAIQEQISTLTTSKSSYIKQMQKKWNSITPPKYTELDIRVLCTNFYNQKEEDNESRAIRGLPKIGLVDSKSWIVKTDSLWKGWSPEDSCYFQEPLLFEGSINVAKHLDPLVISDTQSSSVNLVWTINNVLDKGVSMGLSTPNWIAVWMSLAKAYLPNQFQSLSRWISEADKLFFEPAPVVSNTELIMLMYP